MRIHAAYAVALFVAVLFTAAGAHAQNTGRTADTQAHALPFGSSGHEIALALRLPPGTPGPAAGAAGSEAWTVTVEEAPAWVVVTRREAVAELPESSVEKAGVATEPLEEPVARVRFDLAPGAPVGQPGIIRLVVRNAAGPGAPGPASVVGRKDVAVVVEAPRVASLGAPRPNPSRGAVAVPYVVPAGSEARVRIVDVLGREVAVVAEGVAEAGAPASRGGLHEARVDLGALAAGVYVVVREARGADGAQRAVRQLTVAR